METKVLYKRLMDRALINKVKLPTLSSKVLNVTKRANIFVMDINNKNQLSLHCVSWVLPNIQMTIQYYLTCKKKIRT